FNDRDNAAIKAHKAAEDADAKLAAIKAANTDNQNEANQPTGGQTGDNNQSTGNHEVQQFNNDHASAISEKQNTSNGYDKVTMTRAQYRAQLNSAAKQNSLPQTSSEDSMGIMALGAVSAMLGLGLATKKREA
ncbi:LPXTG cell wall anchor domain-containing protein, partial [Limosilactobacillus antri]